MKPRRVIALVLASIIAVVGSGLLAAGASVGWAYGTQRDDAGFFTTSNERFETDSYALTSDQIDLGQPGRDDWWADRHLATVRITVDDAATRPVFVGIGPASDVEAFLAGIPHDDITEVGFDPFSVDYRRENGGGTSTPAPPTDQTFWVAQATGEPGHSLTWDLEPGRWAIVVMNPDATPGVVADIELGWQVGYLVPIAIGLVIGGIVLLAMAAAMIIVGVGRAKVASDTEPAVPLPIGTAQPVARHTSLVASPLRIEGRLDPDLSRWKWLVKWFLAIPHFVVLVFLWAAFVALTLVAFFAILFTGRYPRSIFEFNVGVLRWSWRVAYYATNVLGTDRYPPFTLKDVEYPATLDVAYPERLSRPLVLVKSWLLAIPHLLIVWAATTSWGDDEAPFVFSGGLLGLTVTIAAFILLFTGRSPIGLYDLIMGAMRWSYRVVIYVALMTDDYPPFRLDQGGSEPPVDGRPSPLPIADLELADGVS
ncbi:MAG: DUF4389 domain-containing protein [Ilumatobacter sp.]|uniref:DUF4389 domain-containing protein n=1 Tax=Ilumatobacter sp. TaxID=1967498 RepID=UPI0032988F08